MSTRTFVALKKFQYLPAWHRELIRVEKGAVFTFPERFPEKEEDLMMKNSLCELKKDSK